MSSDLLCKMAALTWGSPGLVWACCLVIWGGIPEIPLLVTHGSWTKQIENPFDSVSLERFAEAILECWRLICKI